MDTLLISLYEAYEPRCMKKKIKLTLDLGEELFPVIMTDKERLFQLLSIYLDNALHYSPEGKEIQIRVDMSSKELTFWIADHGIGVEEKDHLSLIGSTVQTSLTQINRILDWG